MTDTDGNSVSGSVPVEVVASTKRMVSVPTYELRTQVGKRVTVDVASRAINPFPDSPLTLEGPATTLGSAQVETEGTEVSITPDSTGTVTVTYRINDRLGDPSRAVQGTIIVTVDGGPPDAPTSVHAELVGKKKARVTFTPGKDNGSDIRGYRVYATTGEEMTAECPLRDDHVVCKVKGLELGRDYSFTVVAYNAEGESKRSLPSNPITTNDKPGQMVRPIVTPGDSELEVSWVPPESNGGYQIDHYELKINDKDTGVPYDGTSANIPALNGRDYYVQVRAVNRAGKGPWSQPAWGRPRPSHVNPDQPRVSLNAQRAASGEVSVSVSWTVGSSGGSGWGNTTVNVNGDPITVPGGIRSWKGTLPASVNSVTVIVTVSNIEGDTATSSPQTRRVPPNGPPLTPDAPTITATGNSGQLLVSNVRVKPGRGYVADDLTVFWGTSGEECQQKARARDPNRHIHGTNFIWRGGSDTNGVLQRFFFCQISTSDEVSDSVVATGTPKDNNAGGDEKDWENVDIRTKREEIDGGFEIKIKHTKEIKGMCRYGCRLKVVDSATGTKIYTQSEVIVSENETPTLRAYWNQLPSDPKEYRIGLYITLSSGRDIIKYVDR